MARRRIQRPTNPDGLEGVRQTNALLARGGKTFDRTLAVPRSIPGKLLRMLIRDFVGTAASVRQDGQRLRFLVTLPGTPTWALRRAPPIVVGVGSLGDGTARSFQRNKPQREVRQRVVVVDWSTTTPSIRKAWLEGDDAFAAIGVWTRGDEFTVAVARGLADAIAEVLGVDVVRAVRLAEMGAG